MKRIRVGAMVAAEYVGMSPRGFFNLVERGDVRFITSRKTGTRLFALVDLDRLKADRATWPKRGRPRVDFMTAVTHGGTK